MVSYNCRGCRLPVASCNACDIGAPIQAAKFANRVGNPTVNLSAVANIDPSENDLCLADGVTYGRSATARGREKKQSTRTAECSLTQ